MNKKLLATSTSLFLCTILGNAPLVLAGGTIKVDDTKSINIGAGLRASFQTQDSAAPNESNSSNEFEVDSVRLYINGQIHKNVKFTFNTERDAEGDVNLLDGIAQFEFADAFNLWAGRFLPPSDRSNLSGPYYLGTWAFPSVQKYPAIIAGRDDGAAVWGQFGGGKFKYQIGAFQGRDGGDPPSNSSNQEDELLHAGRLTFNFMDPEPGYYNSSTYYGSKDVLALGLVGMTQKDGSGNDVTPADFNAWSVDLLLEKNLGGAGTVTLEGAYYVYDIEKGVNETSLTQGEGYFALLGYLLPGKLGPGQLRPHVRFQSFDEDIVATETETERTDIGITYVIDGHNARISLVYVDEEAPIETNDFKALILGTQLQF